MPYAIDPYRFIDPTRAYQSNAQLGAAQIGATASQMNSLRDYLSQIYGYNTQANIADLTGQYGLETQRLRNAGAFDVAGLQESGATGRNINDNLGQDYRTQIGAQASMYAPQVASDRFGYVANNFAAPMLQSLFGITPGDPYQTRSTPQFGPGPSYSGGQPPAQTSPQPITQSAPVTQAQPVTGTRQAAMGGGVAPQGMGRPSIRSQVTTSPGKSSATRAKVTQPQAAPSAPRQVQQPAPPRQPQPPAPRVAQASNTGGGLDAMKPMPTQFGGPQITQGPIYTQDQINSMVGRQQGHNAAQAASRDRTAERSMAAQGFSARSPQLSALQNQNAIARSFADQEAATTIPVGYAQANAQHRLATERAAGDQYGRRVQEELARRGQQASVAGNFMNMIFGLA